MESDQGVIRLKIKSEGARSPGIWVDALMFEKATTQLALAAPGWEHDTGWRALAEAALSLYRGPFLAMDRYGDWAEPARERFHRLWAGLIRRMCQADLINRNIGRALWLASDLLDADPDDQDAVYLAMVVHAAAGLRHKALQIYAAAATRLSLALDRALSPAMQQLKDVILTGQPLDHLIANLL